MKEILIQDIKVMKNLKAQFEKELLDLNNKKGLYHQCNPAEVKYAMVDLRYHIKGLEKSIKDMEDELQSEV